jgi:hypothetical protein
MKSQLSAPYFHNGSAAFGYVEAKLSPSGPVCPHRGVVGRASGRRGKSVRPGLWKCYACRKQLTVRMGTVLVSTHVPPFSPASPHQCWRDETAWFLGHRIREGTKVARLKCDATYMGRKAKNRAFKPPKRKQAMMTPVERGGPVRSSHVPSVTAANWQPIIARHVSGDSRYVTDRGTVAAVLGLPFRIYTNTVEGYISILKR